jgi:hypothetical protein
VDPAALPAGAGHDRGDGGLETGVGVGDDQLDAGEPAGLERAQERGPEGAVLAVADVQAQHLPTAISGHPGGDHHRPGDDPAVHAGLEVGGVNEHIREAGVGQGAGPERGHLGVELGADPGDLALGDPAVDAQGLDQVVDLAGGGAVRIGLHDHRQQGPVDAPTGLQQRREERPLSEFGDAQLDVAGLGRQQPRSGPVAMGGALLAALIGPSADVLGGLGIDQRLQHQSEPFADDVQVTASAQCIQQLGQGRLAEGHRGELLGVNLGRITLSFTRWPLALLLSRARTTPQSPPLPGTPTHSCPWRGRHWPLLQRW